jgi:uncharacterized membrane protein YphA (DoxX/SURF4 family)
MTRMAATKPSKFLELLFTLIRLLLGAHFIWMGWVKAMDPVSFLKLVRQYGVIDNPYLLNTVAAALPWFEICCGVLLVLGVAQRGTAVLILGMLVPFSGLVLNRGLELAALKHVALCAISFDCGCGSGEVFVCRKLAENGLLILFSIALLTGLGSQWSLRPRLFGSGRVGLAEVAEAD